MTSVAINAYTGAKAGDEVIEPHDELSPGAGAHEELYLVVSGAAAFEIDGESRRRPAGTMILIGVGKRRAATAKADETTVLVIGGPAGTALPVSPFEHWYAAEPAYLAGDYERAYEIAAAGPRRLPRAPTLNYQLACYRALAGDTEGALRHINVAAAAKPEVLEWAAGDEDLARSGTCRATRPEVQDSSGDLRHRRPGRRRRSRAWSVGSLSAIAPATAITATPPPALRMIAQRRLISGLLAGTGRPRLVGVFASGSSMHKSNRAPPKDPAKSG